MKVEIEHMRQALASYIEATYHLSHPQLVDLRRDLLTGTGIVQEPYVESTPTYLGDRPYASLEIAPRLKDLFTGLAREDSGCLVFDPPYSHQADALEFALGADACGRGIVVTTGTGSGKTESFLLPVLGRLADEASMRPAHFSERAVRALLLYPMNALVNDQLGRLRALFGAPAVAGWFTEAGGRPAKFGRYTGRTLYPGMRTPDRDQKKLKTLEFYLKMEDAARGGDVKARDLVNVLKQKGRWPGKPDSVAGAFDGLRNWYGHQNTRWSDADDLPARANERPQDAELLTRHEIQEACPDLLVTNYSMLEYMLLRPVERDIFGDTRAYFEAHPDERFFLVLDEAHLYRGANGTEVAYLIRRLLDRLGLPTSRVVFIATSASFSNPVAASRFVADLVGIDSSSVTTLQGGKRAFQPAGPGAPKLAQGLAGVPLEMLQSADRTLRAGILSSLVACAGPAEGLPVTLRRTDAGSGTAEVCLNGLDADGNGIEETIALPKGSTIATASRFLLVSDARATIGSVSIERGFSLGTAHAGGMDWACDDLPIALHGVLIRMPVVGRLRNATSGAVSKTDQVVDPPGAAWPLSRLPSALFLEADAVSAMRATDVLLELASLARAAPTAPPLLPARIHLMFRGLPGIWACVDPACDRLPEAGRGGPTGAIYSEPRRRCGCGSQVFELHSCRSCGLAVAHAHKGAPAGREHLWQDNGAAYAGDDHDLSPVHVCLEDPDPVGGSTARAAYLDPRTGRIDGPGSPNREVWLPPLLDGGLFARCPRCGAACGEREAWGISDLKTKGDQPFQELIAVQVLEQLPRPESKTALKGRKALVFSDGRQTASRLAGTMKTYSFKDSLRPLLLAGMQDIRPTFSPSLDDAPLAVALAAARRGIRLRPVGDLGMFEGFGHQAVVLLEDPGARDKDFEGLSSQTSSQIQISVFQAIYAVLQDNESGLPALALATLRPNLTPMEDSRLRNELVLPVVEGLGEEEVRSALVELWLWAAMRKRAIKLSHTPIDAMTGVASLRQWNGNFPKKVQNLLAAKKLRPWLNGDFTKRCLPALRSVFCEAGTGDAFVRAAKVSLVLADDVRWLRCERCTAISPLNPLLGTGCGHCGGAARVIDPSTDPVFISRKSYYRRLWERLNDPTDPPYVPHQLIAEEHSAALNDSGLANAMSRNEAYELRFQDIPIEQDGQAGAPIDVLSCTTTMEVGIDIGGLTAVAMRNVPPGRANYQQRAGRAGRRGAGLSTVVTFCGADSHDQTFFRDPGPIVAGPAPDPVLNLDNAVIARRQAYAYLMSRFQLDRIDLDADGPTGGSVFSSLGPVAGFLAGGADAFSLAGLKAWIKAGAAQLESDVDRLFCSSCSNLEASALLAKFTAELDGVLAGGDAPKPTVPPLSGDDEDGDDGDSEDAEGAEHVGSDGGMLLDRLFDLGFLPKYAFPTDVATFSVFEPSTDPWRPKRRYSPQQGLNAALSQYAPGHEVWVDGQRHLSLGIYAELTSERTEAYSGHRLYYDCKSCGYADLVDKDQGHPEQTRDCPACRARGSLGPARRWMRPPGFAHPPKLEALPPQIDSGPTLRTTSATLALQHSDTEVGIGSKTWPGGTGWQGWSDTRMLVVTNRGSEHAAEYGFNYCNLCGRTEPGRFDPALRQFGGPGHDRPRPQRHGEASTCVGRPARIVLGNEFQTDVVVFRLAFPVEWHLDPDRVATKIAARSAVEALRRAACVQEDLEPNDIDGEFRFAPPSDDNRFIDLYLYDQASGGAGFVKTATRDPQRLVTAALRLLDDCSCDDSCYQCLRSYKNRFDHALFDRHLGADMLRASFEGVMPVVDEARETSALKLLETDLEESGVSTTPLDGGLLGGDGRAICLAHPFRPDLPSSERAARLAASYPVVPVDVMLVLRALPIATAQAVAMPSDGSPATTLASSPDGAPLLSADAVSSGSGSSEALRYAVPGMEPNDLLFVLDTRAMSGGTAANRVPKGSLCLFRPHAGDTTKEAFYFIVRDDGKAFGATGAGWTVGRLQPTQQGLRVRYRAPEARECASELLQSTVGVRVLAMFVRAVG